MAGASSAAPAMDPSLPRAGLGLLRFRPHPMEEQQEMTKAAAKVHGNATLAQAKSTSQ